jgi:hypothetical protein
MCARLERHFDKMRADPVVPASSSTSNSSGFCIPHRLCGWLFCMGLPTKIEVLAISLSWGLGDRATLCRPLGNRRSWLVYGTEVSSGRLPTSGFVEHNCGCRIPCLPTAGAAAWCASCSFPSVAKPPVADETRSYGLGHYEALAGMPKLQKKLVTSACPTVDASWFGMAYTSGHFIK